MEASLKLLLAQYNEQDVIHWLDVIIEREVSKAALARRFYTEDVGDFVTGVPDQVVAADGKQ